MFSSGSVKGVLVNYVPLLKILYILVLKSSLFTVGTLGQNPIGPLRLRALALGFRVWGFGFRVQGLGFRVLGFGFRALGLGFRVPV